MLIVLILLIITVPFAVASFRGAPYVPILKKDARELIELAKMKPGQIFIDLGSGDGRTLRAMAARGIRCIGYEINPYMVLISRVVCWRYRKLVSVHTADLWRTTLPPADVIYVFALDRYMPRLDAKFAAEITQPTTVISYVFKIPGKHEIRGTKNTHVYEYARRSS